MSASVASVTDAIGLPSAVVIRTALFRRAQGIREGTPSRRITGRHASAEREGGRPYPNEWKPQAAPLSQARARQVGSGSQIGQHRQDATVVVGGGRPEFELQEDARDALGDDGVRR
ncbi:hypothetical protein Srubr_62670 [Streptomyces rubradiris]|uniref:Uncharacterized protein n=1 Tax=Streptomyces rubradiris TaxID=285531 RepID=A0ABQ3RKN9_STRRR|nr:hypothetical protein GCM10018792_36120 [Streptomyces rubradiris]GHI56421.1 hypothetical protein Srubr_62670 [Streptomyces rubradiris]